MGEGGYPVPKMKIPPYSGITNYLRSPEFMVRLLFVAAGLAAFFALPHAYVRIIYAKFIACLLLATGQHVELISGDIGIKSSLGIHYLVTADCTYLDWLAVVTPWLVNMETPIRSLRDCLLVTGFIFLYNSIRIYASIMLSEQGLPWFWAHDLYDYLTWYPSVILASGLLFIIRIKNIDDRTKG